MARLIDNTSKDLIRKYHAIQHRIGQYYNSTYEDAVLVAQMNSHEVAMLEGQLKEIKIKMSLMGIDEPTMPLSVYRTVPVNIVSNRYKPNDEST